MTVSALRHAESKNLLEERVAYLLQELEGMIQRGGEKVNVDALAEQIAEPESFEVQAVFYRTISRQKTKLILSQQEEIDHLKEVSLVDTLTGLPNLRALIVQTKVAQAALRRAAHPEHAEQIKPYFLIGLDFINFKKVNDTFGYGVGNDLLKAFGTRIQYALRPGDFVGRLGGDEFVLLIQADDQAAAQVLADRLEQKASEKIPLFVAIAGRQQEKSIDVPFGISPAVIPLDPDQDVEGQFADSITEAKRQRQIKAARAELDRLTRGS